MEDRRHFTRFGAYFLAVAFFTELTSVFLSKVLSIWKPEWIGNSNINMILSAIIVYFIGFPILFLLMKGVPATKPEEHGMKWWQAVLALMMSLPLIYGSNIIGLMITGIIGLLKGSAVDNVALDAFMDTNILMNLVVAVIIAPIMEELVFRKLIIDRTIKYGQATAIFASALMFGLYHGNFNQFIYACTLGVFLAFIYAKTGRIRYTIFIHMTVNLMGGVIVPEFMKAMDYMGYVDAALKGADVDELMGIMYSHIGAWMAFAAYGILLFTMAITGFVLLIVFHKKYKLEKGEVIIPKGEWFKTVLFNPGMGLYCLFWIGVILFQLFA